jgi:hypothetical protein
MKTPPSVYLVLDIRRRRSIRGIYSRHGSIVSDRTGMASDKTVNVRLVVFEVVFEVDGSQIPISCQTISKISNLGQP